MLNAMETLHTYFQEKHSKWVVNTYSLVNITKETNMQLNEGRKEMYRIPQDPQILEQILFLFNNGNSNDRRLMVSDDYSTARISVSMKDPGSYIATGLVKEIQAKVDQVFLELKPTYPQLQATVTGGLALWSRLNDYISWSQIRSFGLAFLVISLILIGIFGSLKLGLAAIIPNTFPILMVFGLMGWWEMPLDLTTLLVAPIVIGIAVDDTIHFLTHYRTALVNGMDIQQSIIVTFREVGQALVFTTLILSTTFFIFVPLSHQGISRFSLLATVAVVTALLADLLLLPSLCTWFQIRVKVQDKSP